MKKIILLAALIGVSFVQKTFAQDPETQSVQKVITDYIKLKNALIKDSADTAKVTANTLGADIKRVPMEKLSSSQHKIWMEHYDALITGAAKIGSTVDINVQRKQFESLSSDLYKLLKGMKVNSVDLYYQYCPMVDAYWVSENSKIQNPYYGKKMLACGSTKETLTANKQ